MLILTRYPGQSIKIGDDITVTVLGNYNNCIRLGFDAPRSINIAREELLPISEKGSNNKTIEGNL